MATVGLALIARDEEDSLPRLLESVAGAFDRVVLLDTGSTDITVSLFEQWAALEAVANPQFSWQTRSFEWVDDFAAARIAADDLLFHGPVKGRPPLVDWAVWADADDTIEGARNIRGICTNADPGVAAFVADYAYGHDQHGNVVCTLRRERLVRAGAGRWEGRVHEAQYITGGTMLLDPGLVRWVHHKDPATADSNERNLRILYAWERDEPENSRVLGYLGTEEAGRGNHDVAVGFYERYLALKTGWDEERAQVHRKLAQSLMALDRPLDAQDVALQALKVLPNWPDSYLSLAEACYRLGEYGKAIEWAQEVLRRGQPDSLLILNPLDYAWAPKLVISAALGALGDIDQAIRVAEEALQVVPNHPELQRHVRAWRAVSKREATAESFAQAAELLISHDEQLKALRLLEECVPYYATDHRRVVALRSMLRERIYWVAAPDSYSAHYSDGGSKPEDVVPDDQIADLCSRLPRAAFIQRQVEELKEAA